MSSLLLAGHGAAEKPANRLGATTNGLANPADGISNPDGGVDGQAERAKYDKRDKSVRHKD